MTDDDAIQQLDEYKGLLSLYPQARDRSVRSELMRRKADVQHIIALAGCMKTITASPRPRQADLS